MRRIICFILTSLMLICLTACTEDIVSAPVPDSYAKCNASGFDIYVPAEDYVSPDNYVPIVSQTFPSSTDIDTAKIDLSNRLVEGTTGSGDYLLTSNKEFLYYAWVSDGSFPWDAITIQDILAQVNITDLVITDTGRLITSYSLQKAILRVNFENTGFNGNVFQYQGYLSIVEMNNKCYFLINGYCSATKEQLSSSFLTSRCFMEGGQE